LARYGSAVVVLPWDLGLGTWESYDDGG
jgi:hypothetical protein